MDSPGRGEQIMVMYECKTCGAQKLLPEGADAHAQTWCGCCPKNHHHGRAFMDAVDCQRLNHPGQPCWNPPTQPVRPRGCTVCRPLRKFAEVELFGIGIGDQ